MLSFFKRVKSRIEKILVHNGVWRAFMTILFCWSFVSFLRVSYFCISITKCAIQENSTQLLRTYLITIVTSPFFALSYLMLILKRKKLTKIYSEVTEDACDKILVKRRCHFAIVITISVVATIIVTWNTAHAFLHFYKYLYYGKINEFAYVCFGCDLKKHVSLEGFKFICILGISTSNAFTLGLSALQIFIYCYIGSLLSDTFENGIISNGNEFDYVRYCRMKLRRTRLLVDELNELFQNLVFAWFASTLYGVCHNFSLIFTHLNGTYRTNQISMHVVVFVRDLTLILMLTLVSSRLPEIEAKMIRSVRSVTLRDISRGHLAELQLFYAEALSSKMGLKAGSCLDITKRLLVSFMGLAFTYTVVFIQLNDDIKSHAVVKP